MYNEPDKYYELLGVAPGASGQELKDAYRDLAKVWHPDRFSHDPRLQQKAQEKLKEINEAYARLTSGKAAARPRPAHAPSEPRAPHAAAAVERKHAGRKHSRLALPTAVVFCAVFVAALSSLAPRGARPAHEQTPTAPQEETQPSDNGQQPDGGTRNAASQPSRGREQTNRRPSSEETSGGEAGRETRATELRPMPTVTVTVDAVNGLLATRDCPAVSRMTYPAGGEPRQYCAVQHKTKVAAPDEQPRPKESRLKAIGKRLVAPFK